MAPPRGGGRRLHDVAPPLRLICVSTTNTERLLYLQRPPRVHPPRNTLCASNPIKLCTLGTRLPLIVCAQVTTVIHTDSLLHEP